MSNTSLYGSAITEVVPISENTSPYSTTAIGVVSANNTTGLYSNASNFTTGQVNSSVYSVNGGTGVTVDPTTGNVLVSIGQPVGPGDSPSFMSLSVTGPGVFQTEPDVVVLLQYPQIEIGDGSSSLQAFLFQGSPNSGFLYFDPVTDTFNFTNATSGFGTPLLTLGSTAAVFNEPIKLNGSTSGSSQFAVPATGSTLTYTLPGTAGAVNTVLTNDGSGTLSWTSGSSLGLVNSVTGSGAGISVSPTTGAVVVSNTGVTSIIGTANQVIASSATGAVTLSTPQDIATTSSPTFAGITAGVVTVGPGDNDTITTTSGNLFLQSTGGTVQVNNDFKSIGTISTNYYTLPLTDGINGQVINTDGSGNLGWVDGSFTIGTTAIALGDTTLTLGGLTSVEVTQDPVTNLQLATKQYVDNSVSTGLTFHAPVQAATTASLASITGGTVTYNQPGGAGVGVGATITLSNALTVLDGYTLLNTNRVLVKDEINQTYNGVYTWATGGTVLTRATDADTYGVGPNTLSLNDYFFVQNGTTQANIAYVLNAPVGAIIFGTSAITFAEFSRSNVYTGVSPIDVTGTVISLTTVPINLGGTGQITANDAINALLPSQTLNTGKLLTTNGTDTSWTALSSIGVTSITGTANQIIASASTGAVTLSTPQDIATTSNPTFADMTLTGDLAVNGGDITTTAATFNLVNNVGATTVNFAQGATTLSLGAATGTTTVRNNLVVTGDLAVNGGDITTTAATFNLVNANATTVNFAQGATTLSIGATTGTSTVRNALSVTGGNITTTTGSNIISGSGTTYSSIVAQEGRYSGSNDIQRDNNSRVSNGFLASNWANGNQSGQRVLIRDYQLGATSTPGYSFPVSAFASEVSRFVALITTAASGDGTTATLTFAAQTVPPYIVGNRIVVDNIVPTGYRTNISAVVTACTTTTVSYANTTTGAQITAAAIRGVGAANANDSLMTIYSQPNMGSTNGSGLGDGWSSDTMPYPPGAFRLTASQNQRQTTTATFTAAFANATINAQTTGQMTVSAMTGTSLATTAAAGTGTTATLTFAAQTYIPYAVGSFITVAGVTPTGYNGYYKVTACTTTTVSFANTTTGAQTVAGTTQGAISVGNEVRSATLTTAAPGSVFIVMRQQSGTPGGAGVYALNVATGTIGSGTITSLYIQAAQDLLFSTVPANTAVSDVTRFSAFAFTPNSSNLGANLSTNNLGIGPVFASYVPRYQKITTIATDAVLGDIITIPAHGLRIRDTVIPTTTANGLTATTIYFVQSVTNANQVRLSTTAGGAGLTGLTAGTGLYLEIETTGGYGIGGDNSIALSPTTGRASSVLIATARLGYGQGGTTGNGQKYQGMVSADELGLIRFAGTAGVVGSTQFQYMYPTQIISSATENYNYTSHGSQTVIQNTRAGQSAAVIVPTNISGNGTTVTVSYTNTGQWFSGQSPFVNSTYITIAGAQPSGYNGTYQIASISATQLTFTSATTGTMIIPGTLTQGMVNSIVTNPTSQTYASDVHTFTTAPGSSATAVQTLITANATSTTFTKPVGFPVYTAVAAGAITGAVGQQISISNSPTVGGRMAFWDTTNVRWSYISDNAAV